MLLIENELNSNEWYLLDTGTSLTSTGLQRLITAANKHISSHGLRFNPIKTTCTTFGTNHLTPLPTWQIDQNSLKETIQVTYLGTILSNDVSPHIDARIRAVRGAFYGLQGAYGKPSGSLFYF